MNETTCESIVDEVASARDFQTAVERLTDWAQNLTGCQAAMLRFRADDSESEGWIPALVERGFDYRFVHDEVLIGQEECLCGRVCRGHWDDRFPFFTDSGSFTSGDAQRIAGHHPLASLGNVRGRCFIEGFQSLIIVPLLGANGTPVGCLHLADYARDKFKDHLDTLEKVCAQCGPLLLRFSEPERERCLIRAVESALTPPEIADTPGLETAVSYLSATETARLGGDFYDVIALPDGRVLLVVGDYSGRGIGAAGMAARARFALTTALLEHRDVDVALAAAQRQLEATLPRGKFVTVAALAYSPDGSLEGGLAGHPPPLVVEESGAARELRLPSNMPLGFFLGERFATGTARLEPGQTLLLFTDGLVESRSRGEFFGTDGIERYCRQNRGHTLDRLTAGLCQASEAFGEKTFGGDDRLVLAARRRATASNS